MPILVGNAWPTTLFQRDAYVRPITLAELKFKLSKTDFVSAWGHSNTIGVVSELLGHDFTPRTPRPRVQLTKEGYPTLHGIVFRRVYVISPSLTHPTRRSTPIGEKDIRGWTLIEINF